MVYGELADYAESIDDTSNILERHINFNDFSDNCPVCLKFKIFLRTRREPMLILLVLGFRCGGGWFICSCL